MAEIDSYLVVDEAEAPSRIAFFCTGKIAEVWRAASGHELGAVHLARVINFHSGQQRATAQLHDGTKISWQTQKKTKLVAGQLAQVSLTAFGWQDKPMQASMGAQIAGYHTMLMPNSLAGQIPIRLSRKQADKKMAAAFLKSFEKTELEQRLLEAKAQLVVRRRAVPKQTADIQKNKSALIEEALNLLNAWQQNARPSADMRAEAGPREVFAGLPLLQQACFYADTQDIQSAGSGFFEQLKADLTPYLQNRYQTSNGAVFWIEPTRAAVMVDIDSATSNLSPFELATHILPELFWLLRLRGLAGRVIIDLPYLNPTERQTISSQFESLCQTDPRQPEFFGFTPSGLAELRYRYSRPSLDKVIESL